MTFTLISRSLILYILILFLVRLMGKRQLGEMQPFELVITLIIADLATIPMAETALPLIQGIIPLLILVCIHFFIGFLSRKNLFLRKLFNGKPVILFDPDGINYQNMQRANMNFNDLLEGLHSAGYFNLEELLYVILQTNGTMTVVNRAPFTPLTANDLNIEKDTNTLPIILISKGKTIKENMKIVNTTEDFLLKNLNKLGINSIKEILILTINNNGKMYVQPYNKSFETIETDYSGGNW